MVKSMHSERYKVFRLLLISAREAAGLTQLQVAQRLGQHQSFVSKYESGDRRLDFTEFMELAEALSIDVPAFLDAYRRQLSIMRPHG